VSTLCQDEEDPAYLIDWTTLTTSTELTDEAVDTENAAKEEHWQTVRSKAAERADRIARRLGLPCTVGVGGNNDKSNGAANDGGDDDVDEPKTRLFSACNGDKCRRRFCGDCLG
jgi:hypothetical protein